MAITSFQYYIAYLITFIKRSTIRNGGYSDLILDDNIVGGANNLFQDSPYYNRYNRGFSSITKLLNKGGFSNLSGLSGPNKRGFSNLTRPPGPNSNSFSGITGLFRFRKSGFSGIPKNSGFMGLSRLFRPLGPLDGGGFRGPPGLPGPPKLLNRPF